MKLNSFQDRLKANRGMARPLEWVLERGGGPGSRGARLPPGLESNEYGLHIDRNLGNIPRFSSYSRR
ncbi:hypothetical protein RRG08_039886 [Elysia crispata]|uniref:Uncharacterized protein n=1 Tax=Elysia crispata TaxID=231223 RepID=A0AAE0ZVV0_9GAST|nr:hypothetical protein RRG08_039886 [Elysia crispata]